jgi:hypothetical protein
VSLKAALATVALGAAAVQVLLALWLYRRLPLAARPARAVRPRTGCWASPFSR